MRIELPDFARWELYQKRPIDRPSIIPFVEVRTASFSMTITLPEDFLVEFNQPKNVAEQAIVSALIEGVERLVGTGLTEARRKELVREIIRNEDSRFFHILETNGGAHGQTSLRRDRCLSGMKI